MIQVQGLKKTFLSPFLRKPFKALKGLSFNVKKGKIVGFLGSNGAGKTTTLKILMGLVKKDEGQVVLPEREKIGFLTERPYFYDHLTGEEFLTFCSKLFLKEIPKSRVYELLKEVGLAEAAKRPLRHYSKGMLQRVGLAQALINDPELLILDEPMSGLDPDGRSDVVKIIQSVNKKGVTVFFSTHLISDIQAFCDEVVIINRGELVVQDSVENLVKAHSKNLEEIYLELKGRGK